MSELHAITVIGRDRPGIIGTVTADLAELGMNIEDSTMTLLRGHFAMTLVCRGSAQETAITEALSGLAADGSLTVTVGPVDENIWGGEDLDPSWMLTVHGGDRPGIVSAVSSVLATAEGNITDLTTRLAGDLYVLVAEVAFPEGTDTGSVRVQLQAVGEELGVDVELRELESDEL